METIVKSLQELVRVRNENPMILTRKNRRGDALWGVIVTVLAVIGLLVVLSSVF